MMNDQNNLGNSGEPSVQQAPAPNEDAGGAAGTADPTADFETSEDASEQLSPQEIQDLKSKAAKADENWDRYVRAVADFDNYKKRAARERTDAVKYANESLIEKMLPIVDNFEAALAATNAADSNVDSIKQGVSMIYSQLKNFLGDSGVEEVDAAGKAFDPNLHEAVSQQPSEDVPEGQVLHQMRKGYKLRDRLIRPAMVVVAKKP